VLLLLLLELLPLVCCLLLRLAAYPRQTVMQQKRGSTNS
jgi:hypothetical protein